ncbi:TMEM175 family protein [Tractidigestivibacter montrealensis]|uniref:TMEM175 family protein n=1 Tax=Tractidigestivibacter montrealensis TaxID=2972466 RepID=A0ABT1Z5H3_9ACTN|nr:TMEM175 family protein [Tractidigestivibacter montrealensis]MCR9035463.1 TMEM175 family protein [Tractidigestivibacter montrealensis]
MDKGRMEAFSDGVIAIIITIMVLGITAPEGDRLADLLGLLPAIAAYAVSFIGVGTYWNNHHHLLKLVNRVSGRMLWSNLAFLFVLSFFPLATDWMQKTGFAALPTTCYVVVNMLVSLTYMNLERVIRRDLSQSCPPNPANEREAERRAMVEKRSLLKERLTLGLEVVGLVIALVLPSSHLALVALVIAFLLWIVPDLRIVRLLDFLAEEEG